MSIPTYHVNNGMGCISADGTKKIGINDSDILVKWDIGLPTEFDFNISKDGMVWTNGTTTRTTPLETIGGISDLLSQVEAVAPAVDATTLNVNNTIQIQNGESPTLTNSVIISSSGGTNRLLLDNAVGSAGQVLTSGGALGTLSWATPTVPNLQSVVNSGGDVIDGGTSLITITNVAPSFGVNPETLNLSSTLVSISQDSLTTTEITAIAKNGVAVSETPVGSSYPYTSSRMGVDNITTYYYNSLSNFAGVALETSSNSSGGTLFTDGEITASHTESVGGTKTKDITLNIAYNTTTNAWVFSTPDALATTVPIRFNQNTFFNVGGTATFNNGLTLASGKYITTTAGVGTNPTALQIGHLEDGTALNVGGTLTSTNWISVGSISLGSGTWSVIGYCQVDGLNTATRCLMGLGTTQKSNVASNTGAFNLGVSSAFIANSFTQYPTVSGFYQNLTASAVSLYLNLRIAYTTTQPVIGGSDFQFRAVKIA